MRYLIVLLLLCGCGIKPSVSCDVDVKEKNIKEITDDCVENPHVGLTKDF